MSESNKGHYFGNFNYSILITEKLNVLTETTFRKNFFFFLLLKLFNASHTHKMSFWYL